MNQAKVSVMKQATNATEQPAKPYKVNSASWPLQQHLTGLGRKLEISIPRDREGTFEPQLVKKRQTRLRGLDTRIVNLYAKGMSTREIQSHLEEMYGVDVSAGLISNVTDAVNDEIKTLRTACIARRSPDHWRRSTRSSIWIVCT
jgi:putative transposase